MQERLAQLTANQSDAIWAQIATDSLGASADISGALAGVPFASKDLFPLSGAPTRSGGRLHSRIARQDSTLVAAMRAVGAIPIGKTHLHEFAYGLTGENPHFGAVSHPQFADRTAGGSSSGSAAAADIVPFALGTDTGGSLRVPAAFCGLYSWHDVPRHPWISDGFPLAPSFDTAGWLTSSPVDIRILNTTLWGDFPSSASTPRKAYLDAASLHVEMASAETQIMAAKASSFCDPSPISSHADFAAELHDTGFAYSVLQSTEAFAVHQTRLDARKSAYGSGRLATHRSRSSLDRTST
ncbi:MAG: amidase [Candidatus Synoicihabitans palmerolidicus]|nr:amidase [Candidatus Synoicihabitans palmerolidicus]